MNNKKSNTNDVVNESDDSTTESAEEQTNRNALDYTTEIIFSAPFRTDIVLDSKKLLKEYKEFNSEVERNLNSTNQFAGWKLDPHIDYSEKSNYGLISPDKPGLTNIAPYFIGYVIRAEDKFSGDTLEHLQTKINDKLNSKINKTISNKKEKKDQQNFDNNFIVSKAKLKFYEFGFGSITVYVECKKVIDESALKYAIESNKIKSLFENFISGYIDEYANSVPKKLLQEPQFERHNNLIKPRKVYWTHRLISFILISEAEETSDANISNLEKNSPHEDKVNKFFHEKKNLLTQLITVDDEGEITSNELKNRGQIFIPGVGNSIIISDNNIDLVSDVPEEQKETKLEKHLEEKIDNISNIVSITGTHSAFVHYFHENLLYFVNKIIKASEKEKRQLFDFLANGMTKLTNDILRKLDIFSHINFLFQEYKSFYLSSIGKGAYHKLVEAWEFNKQWDGVKQQINTLEKIYDRNDEFIDRRQQKALNILALIFAFTTVITSFGEVNLYRIDSFNDIFIILFLVVVGYFVCKKIISTIKNYLSKLCYKISYFCRKISAKDDQ